MGAIGIHFLLLSLQKKNWKKFGQAADTCHMFSTQCRRELHFSTKEEVSQHSARVSINIFSFTSFVTVKFLLSTTFFKPRFVSIDSCHRLVFFSVLMAKTLKLRDAVKRLPLKSDQQAFVEPKLWTSLNRLDVVPPSSTTKNHKNFTDDLGWCYGQL